MKAHTSQFKEDIKTIGKQLDSKIIYELDGVVQTLTSEQLNSITPTFQGAILKSVMKELDIDSNIDIPIGTEVNYQFGLKTEGDFEYVNYGNYIVYSSEKQEDYDSYKIVCYDKMLYSMKKNEDLGITYPKTIRDYMNALCNKLGLEFKNKDDKFANFDRQIGEELYAGQDYTYRDIFDQLAEATASTICLDENDKVEIRYINDLTDLYIVNGKEVTFESDIEYPMSFQVNGNTEQTTYSGKNLLNYIDSLQSISGLTNTLNKDGSITTVGKPTVNYVRIVKDYDITNLLEDGQKYTISQTDTSLKTMLQITAYKNDGTITYYSSRNGANVLTINKSIYTKFLACVQTTSMSLWGDESLTINNKYMLCKDTDTADTSFEPYVGGQPSPNPDYPQEIENVRGVENLLKLPDGTYESNGIKAVIKDGVITLNGTATATDFLKIPIGNLKSGTYSMSANNDQTVGSINGSGQFASYRINNNTDNKTIQECILGKKNATAKFTILDDPKIAFIIRTNVGLTYNNFVIKPQLEEGPIAHNFVPNGSNYLQLKNTTDNESKIINIDLKGNNLCSNKEQTLKDELVIENGRAKIIKKYDEYVFTGNETFSFTDNGARIMSNTGRISQLKNVYISIPQSSSNITPSFCTHYILSSQDNVVKGSNKFAFSQWSNQKFIYFPADYSTIEEFKAKLKALYDAGTPVKVQFQLENPETIELDTVTPLKSYIGQNNISNNADADMNVTYSKNYETIDANFLKDINVNFGEKYGPVNSIVLSRSAESDNIYLQDEESITKNGLCEIKIKDNQIMNWNDRSDYLPDILEKLDGLEYYLNDFVSTGIAYLDLCDKYNVNVFENNYPCIMFNDELLVTQGLEENVHTNMPEETQTDYTKSDKTDRRINQAYIIVDKQQQEITSLTKQTNSIQDNLANNYYTIEQSNTLIQNAQSGLTNTFSEAGGNNIFRNTGLWFTQSDANNPYEYWTGNNVSKQNTDKSSNGSLMMLKKGTLEQEQVVANGNYTVSFKYKKLIQLATCKVIVNDNEYELTQMTDTEWQTGSKDADGNIVIKPLEVTSNHINVKFTSTVDNAIEIYDLMVNAGTVKLAYSQNENEVTTDTVNISKGITITSSANDTKFKANADGIRIVDKNNEKTILTKFTDKGMSTKELEVENSATIVKVLVQNVGSQTWFTRI